jgi:hypothetical protein
MRKIKFRSWDKQAQKMVYSNEVYPKSVYKFEFDLLSEFDFKLMKMVDRYNVTDEDGDSTFVEVFKAIDADMMQYTGLKDMDNQDIYENDYVELYSMGAKIGIAKIIFNNSRWEVEHIGEWKEGLRTDLRHFVNKKDIKVIEKPLYID